MQLIRHLSLGNILGENVLWHPGEQRVWWTDIHACRLYAYSVDQDKLVEWQTPERLTAFGFTSEPGRLVASFASGFADYWPASGRVNWRARPEQHLPGNRFNDGRVDPAGRFWAGTLVETDAGQRASLYRLDGSRCHQVLDNLSISNGLCWSPDGRRCYHTDSPTGRILVYDFELDTGALFSPRLFAETPPGVSPDGACTDAAGNLWSAHWGGASVVCYGPDGHVLQHLALPVSQPTCVAFGGPDLNWLMVTSARENLSQAALLAEPAAGDLFIYAAPSRGLSPAFATI